MQFKAMLELKAKGVNFHRWPDDVLQAFEAAWHEVVAEEAAKDQLFKRIFESFDSFHKAYVIWQQHGYLD